MPGAQISPTVSAAAAAGLIALAIGAALVDVSAQVPTCAPSDASILLSVTTPDFASNIPPPFESILCNGLECPSTFPDFPDMFPPGALIASMDYDVCPDGADIVIPNEAIAPLLKTIGLGSTTPPEFTVQSLQVTEGVEPIFVVPGTGTLKLFAYTDVYFRAPEPMGMGFSCALDPVAGDFALIPTPFGDLFSSANLPTDPQSGLPLVCIYACNSLQYITENVTLCSAEPGVTQGPEDVVAAVEFTLSPLSNAELACDDAVAPDVGPFVTPTKMFPATVNGMTAQALCGAPGEQLGAFVGTSSLSECCLDPPCQEEIELVVDAALVEKVFTIQGIPVSSSVMVDFQGSFTTLITQPSFQTRFTLYVWTSTYFRCQNMDGTCPPDPASDIPPLAFTSPFAGFFDGICNPGAQGGFPACVYACLEFKVVECVLDCQGDVPNSLGQVFQVDPMLSDASFPSSTPFAAQTVSDPHFQGFQGQSYDFHGQPGLIYHLLSDHPDLSPRGKPAISINARVDQAFSASVSDSPTGALQPYIAKEGATWLTDVGIQVGSSCIVISSKSTEDATASSDFAIAVGAVRVDGQEVVLTGKHEFGDFTLSIQNKKSFVHTEVSAPNLQIVADIVPPPKTWMIDASLLDEVTHVNVRVERVLLRRGLGVMGMSALDKNAAMDTATIAPREADFETPALCGLPSADRLHLLE